LDHAVLRNLKVSAIELYRLNLENYIIEFFAEKMKSYYAAKLTFAVFAVPHVTIITEAHCIS